MAHLDELKDLCVVEGQKIFHMVVFKCLKNHYSICPKGNVKNAIKPLNHIALLHQLANVLLQGL